ncbi:hypothetical protein P22_0840 [Propionispora sp. 2/2-37]|uniref:NADH-quinone oxidoreductase subunit C n=1 Tax=Propionispora sp. 2/2-37 TaxID=1677858 RepID=UPI0006BB5D5D|nr:NADH-quinone oxidoreductase subunit C [Propionispora sp. 2/2-37]CUH94774.1 hypothetical protein P22_0840 [Propionispora sp. 2/2-37]
MSRQIMKRAELESLAAATGPDVEIIGEDPYCAMLVEQKVLLTLLRRIKDGEEYRFDLLSNLTAVEYPEYFEVVYHLYSRALRKLATVKTRSAKEKAEVVSVTGIWPGADFQEREVYDLLGISFTGHPNLRRILLPEDFNGHPLRKEFKAVSRG